MRLAAVSVDLDAVRYYRAIHGLPSVAPGADLDPVLETAIERLADWASALSIPLTWFVVGRDLDDERFAERLFGLCRRGHELANHTLDHFYDLTRREVDVMREQVFEAAERLTRITGRTAHGFRAPGYVMNAQLATILRELAVPYDSSLFPCPIYFGAKAVALFGQRLFGRQSHAIMDDRAVLRAPIRPHRLHWPAGDDDKGVLELPIQVTPKLRLPFIGTSLTMLGPSGSRVLTRGLLGEPFVNLELHGLDALDAADGLSDLAVVQPDLRIAWRRKLASLTAAVDTLRRAGFTFVRLEQAAAKYGDT